MTARFRPGRLVATPGALDVLEKAAVEPVVLLARHLSGDWGDLDEADRAANAQALLDGGRLMSAYTLADQTRIWVITEAADDRGRRPCTTVLLPQEY